MTNSSKKVSWITMDVKVNKYWVWFWQIPKILRLRRELRLDYLAEYSYSFKRERQTKAVITMIAIRPFYWKRTLRHELGHHDITTKCHGVSEALAKNDKYDFETGHGMTS